MAINSFKNQFNEFSTTLYCQHAIRPYSLADIFTFFVIDILAIALRLKLHSWYARKIISMCYYKLITHFSKRHIARKGLKKEWKRAIVSYIYGQ